MNTIQKLESQCFLLTNGLGGYCTQTMAFSSTRQDASILMRAKTIPNERINLVHRLQEEVVLFQKNYYLSSQQPNENGYQYLKEYAMEDVPSWTYEIENVSIQRTISMKRMENTTAIQYCIQNLNDDPVTIRIRPLLSFFEKGQLTQNPIIYKEMNIHNNVVYFNNEKLHVRTDGKIIKEESKSLESYYEYDARDGRSAKGYSASCFRIEMEVKGNETKNLNIIFSDKRIKETNVQKIIEEYKKEKMDFAQQCDFFGKSKNADILVRSAMDYISERSSTKSKTILAGFPFFADWGRDTMIALPGILLSTNHYDMAKEVLSTFLKNEQKGLIPNLFPENCIEPMYNTVDAALLLIECMYLYYQKSNDLNFIKESYSILENIIYWYKKGTDYAIYMDRDHLIHSGQGFDQVTWMDVRIDDILPTPRHGKCVEINAYWYNALRIMDVFQNLLEKNDYSYIELAKKVEKSFNTQFWIREKGYLKDVLTDDFSIQIENQIRCNQVWAMSLSFTMLTLEQERQILETIENHLYTPYGLRTLSKTDPDFHPKYEGSQFNRDMAYHQGTIWPYPLGAYYRAYLRVHSYNQESIEKVQNGLYILNEIFQEGCLNQICEVYDGLEPSISKGCFAQAWSVAEILRVYECLFKKEII